MSKRQRLALALALTLVLAVVALIVAARGWGSEPGSNTVEVASGAKSPAASRPEAPRAGSVDARPPAEDTAKATSAVEPAIAPPTDERAARDRLRAQILAAQRRRASEAAPTEAAAVEAEGEYPPGELKNRVPGAEGLVDHLNADLMPLASECIDLARERDPELTGMLAISLEIIADEELGSIVESVEYPEAGGPGDDELQTCIRESTLSMTLPPSASGGAFMLTLQLDDE